MEVNSPDPELELRTYLHEQFGANEENQDQVILTIATSALAAMTKVWPSRDAVKQDEPQ